MATTWPVGHVNEIPDRSVRARRRPPMCGPVITAGGSRGGRRLRGASVRGREAHRDVETPAGLGPGGEGRVVGGGDGLDDGQAKTEAVRLLRGIGAEPLEGLEEPVAAAWASASWPSKATSTAMP